MAVGIRDLALLPESSERERDMLGAEKVDLHNGTYPFANCCRCNKVVLVRRQVQADRRWFSCCLFVKGRGWLETRRPAVCIEGTEKLRHVPSLSEGSALVCSSSE